MPALAAPRLRTKVLGLGLVVVVLGLVGVSVGIYQKRFSPAVRVEVRVARIGHQLIVPADVKVRGLVVGEVRGVHDDGSVARMDVALDPSLVRVVPSNVSARILPKTLFGEKFVELELPPVGSAARPLRSGDVIGEDRSSTAIEAERVFADLVPLLAALRPVELNMTLSALSAALAGRGVVLGQNLVGTDRYFAGLNPDLGRVTGDISGLADLASNVDAATPDLLAMARNFSANARTVTAKADVLGSFLAGTKGFADTAAAVVGENADRLTGLATVSVPTLALLARYSPEFPCLLQGLTAAQPGLEATFTPRNGGKPGLHIELEVIPQPTGYTYPNDRPTYDIHTGPNCYGLPAAPGAPVGTTPPTHAAPAAQTSGAPTSGPTGAAFDLARILAAPQLGVSGEAVPDIVGLLTAPQIAGTRATVS